MFNQFDNDNDNQFDNDCCRIAIGSLEAGASNCQMATILCYAWMMIAFCRRHHESHHHRLYRTLSDTMSKA